MPDIPNPSGPAPQVAPFRAPAVSRAALRALLLRSIEGKLAPILAQARPDGRFGTDPWIVRDQDAILTLALLYLDADGPHYRSPALLTCIAAGGRYLRSRQDARGMFPFDKKDGSYWGPIYMPWTYLRWIVTYDLIAAALAPDDRAVWAEGLRLGYGGIAATELSSLSNIYPGPLTGHPPLRPGEVIPWIHNIPCHHATGLFLAGRIFAQPAWMDQARAYMQQVIAAQSEHGWWTEHSGPVVLYNRVYLEALGLYHRLSGDDSVRPALERGNRFHLNYTYPDGAAIETVDERNPYPPLKVVSTARGERRYLPSHLGIHPGLFATDEGRALLAQNLALMAEREPAEIDGAELLYLCLPAGDADLAFTGAPARRFRMGTDALVAREDPWLLSLSAYCCPRTPNRFIQDRQNLVSIYHRDAGLILGGGNTKLQPRWSTLTVGDPDLVSPAGATKDTNLAPAVPLAYTQERCVIAEVATGGWTQRITAAGATIELAFTIVSPRRLQIGVRLLQAAPDGRAAAVHLTFIRYEGAPVRCDDGTTLALAAEPWEKTGVAVLRHHVWALTLPRAASIRWPVLPHNPYTADGHADVGEGRLVVSLPLVSPGPTHELVLTVGSDAGPG